MAKFKLKLNVMVSVPATCELEIDRVVVGSPEATIKALQNELGDVLKAVEDGYEQAHAAWTRGRYVGKEPRNPLPWSVDDDDINPENWEVEIEEWEVIGS